MTLTYTNHARARTCQRGIKRKKVKEVIEKGSVIIQSEKKLKYSYEDISVVVEIKFKERELVIVTVMINY